MTDAEYRAERQKFEIETQQQIRRIYALLASGEELSIKAEQRRIAAEEQRAKEAKQHAEEAKQHAEEAKQRAEEAEQRRIAAEEQRAKEAKQRAEEARQRAEAAEKRSQELDEKLKKVSDDISRVNKQCGGTSNNIGSVTEEFFFRAMSAHMRVDTIVFDDIERNARYKSINGTDTGELDLVLYNGIFVLIVETKYRCHYNDVLDFENKMSKIQLHTFKEFGTKQLLFAMASEKFNGNAVKYAKKHNMILLRPDGQKIHADTDACTALNQ